MLDPLKSASVSTQHQVSAVEFQPKARSQGLLNRIRSSVTRIFSGSRKDASPESQPLLEKVAKSTATKVENPSIMIDETTSLTYNRKTGEYVYMAKAPPIINLVISGGGAKGVILPGVVKALDEKEPGGVSARDKLVNIVGSSVGALTGCAIAVGMSGDDLIKANEKVDFTKILGKGRIKRNAAPLEHYLRTSIKNSISKNLAQLFKNIKGSNIDEFITSELEKNGKSLSPSERTKVIADVKAVIAMVNQPDISKVQVTFSMLHSLHLLNPKVFKELTVTATCCEDGKTYYFNATNTPNLDITLACKASAALPIIVDRVKIERQYLLPGCAGINKEVIAFTDGGYLDNVSVSSVQEKHEGEDALGVEGQNLQTLALVFDTAKPSKGQSPFLDAVVKKGTLYKPGRMEKFVRDRFVKYFVDMRGAARNTEAKVEGLAVIQKQYTQRNIPLKVPIGGTAFKKAKQKEKQLVQMGYEQAKTYLQHHDQELIAHSFKSLDDALSRIPKEKCEAAADQIAKFRESTVS